VILISILIIIIVRNDAISSDQEDGGEVVSVGTGDACVVNSSLKTDGRAVTDCHAEVIARKALLKYDIL